MVQQGSAPRPDLRRTYSFKRFVVCVVHESDALAMFVYVESLSSRMCISVCNESLYYV